MLYDASKDTSIAAVLIRARALIADERNWCQRRYTDGPKMCAATAINRAQGLPSMAAVSDAWKFVVDVCGSPLTAYNDTHSHAEVIALFDRGIVEAGKIGA